MLDTLRVDITKITLERANQGISANELSKRAGVSKNVVSNMERGSATPRLDTLGKIAKALGMRLEDFIKDKEEEANEQVANI
ncbi:helix-turn-helix domain-containing protein [Sporosarcina psychrophila]|uniref:Transcriptional regulator with XRE-family HTH domain n=1 Tax=Sporosarcina psychrophila TaxID=1476 RepID=A0ABV2K9T3_SPOPS